jgi:hypothetical protein
MNLAAGLADGRQLEAGDVLFRGELVRFFGELTDELLVTGSNSSIGPQAARSVFTSIWLSARFCTK